MKTLSKSSVNQSVYSAFEIVNFLAGKGWCRVKDIAMALQLDSAKIHRILKTMALLDYIEYDALTHRYRLGMAFFSISYHMTKGESILSMARQPMEWLAKKTAENVNFFMLSSLDHSKIVNIYRIENNIDISDIDEGIGESDSVYNTAGGKCLLAFLPLNEQRSIAESLNYVKYTDSTLTTANDLLENLRLIRERGYALDHGEYNPHISCIAMPVFTPSGDIYASISISSSKSFDENLLEYYKAALTDGVQRMVTLF